MLGFYIPWKYFRQHCCLDIIIFYSIPNCSQCDFWLEHPAGRNAMEWNRNLSTESCQSRIHSAGTDRLDLPRNYNFFFTLCDHKSLRCPALVKLKAFELFLWKKKRREKKSWPQSEHWDEIPSVFCADYFSPFKALFEVSGCCTWFEQEDSLFQENPELLQLVENIPEKNHAWILQRAFLGLHQQPGLGRRGNLGFCLVGLGLLFKFCTSIPEPDPGVFHPGVFPVTTEDF